MIEGIYISASGMLPKSTRHEAIANNLANMEVPGFKRDSMFLREVREARKQLSGDYPDWRINRAEGTWTDHEQGALRRTGNMFNMAINGQGFFAVETPDGVQYTRNGSFARSNEGTLVNLLGHPVLDVNGETINVPGSFEAPIIDASGVIKGRDELLGIDSILGRLQVTDFPQLYDPNHKAQTPYQPVLTKSKNGFYIPQPGMTQQPAEAFELSQGFLEEANVQPVLEMVKMIDVYRSYEADQRAIQVQDTTLDRAVNDVGVVR
ncbi:MAG: flagellar hook-basal body protein [Gemmatimonadetes bacterium]|jgi:flagellar basal-body rod protein FlgF|nr:flagellar hook-basal body protein [Gemmatimonadota bacterium]